MPKTSKKSVDKPKVDVEVKQQPEHSLVTNPVRKIIYPELDMLQYSTAVERGPMTPDDWKELLGWETEEQYGERRVSEENTVREIMVSRPEKVWIQEVSEKLDTTIDVAIKMLNDVASKKESKPEQFKYRDDEVHCIDRYKRKVKCRYNANNRPFDMGWCEDLIHTILFGQWAGPYTIPGETVNGETVRLSRYGMVLSGQHQGTACILADEDLQIDRAKKGYSPDSAKYPFWNDHKHLFIETIVILGISDDERVLRTIDYVKERTMADVLFTMPLYKNNNATERKELTRMLSSAIDTLWRRTAAKGYKTHPELTMFLKRHNRLLACVEHLFKENNAAGTNEYECKHCKVRSDTKSHDDQCVGGNTHEFIARTNRRITSLHLNPGHCAALCYLMGASATTTGDDPPPPGEIHSDDYRNMEPPNEDVLNWSMWDRALAFWVALASDRGFMPVRTAINRLTISKPGSEDNQGMGGRLDEKVAILSLAWGIFKTHPLDDPNNPPFNKDDIEQGGALDLHYTDLDEKGNELPEGKVALLTNADFLGIDCPSNIARSGTIDTNPPDPPSAPKEEQERLEEVRKDHQEKHFPTKPDKKVSERTKLDDLADRAASNLGNTGNSVVASASKKRTVVRKR